MLKRFTPRASAELIRARSGVFGYFATSGFAMGAWAGGLPALDERLSLGPGRVGTCLLLIAAGAMVSMVVAGRITDRFTSRNVARISGPVTSLALLGPALAPTYGWLMALAVLYGMCIGVIEISMNVNSIEVETRYGRPIVSAFHGFWSLGGAVGGALTSLGLHLRMDSQLMLVVAVVVTVGAFGWFGRMLLPPPPHPEADSGTAKPGRGSPKLRWGLIVLLGLVAFAGHISEGAAIDWAAIHARTVLDTSLSSAPIAYTVFGVAMTTIRLLGDPIRGRLGPAITLLLAGLFATAGYGLVLVSPTAGGTSLLVACVGWALTGIGLATVVPVVFSSVGAAGGAAVGKALSTITLFSSVGMLIGPAIIGQLAEISSLPVALIVPAVLALLVAVTGPPAAKALRGHTDGLPARPKIPEAV
jgi:MFS family permease